MQELNQNEVKPKGNPLLPLYFSIVLVAGIFAGYFFSFENFANPLAEVRKYGEGLIIADQIPNKLVSDVIKNTNTKIVHRLLAADDRNAIGDSMGLSDEQKDFLPLLQPGETIIYCGGWHAPVRVQIRKEPDTNEAEISEEEIRLQGQRQLWEQRHSLIPHLAAHPAMDSP